jgi:polysaccharide biosynthesis transport protein
MQVQRDMKVGDVLRVIHRWRWFVSCLTVAIVAAAGVWSFTRTPIYKSTASVVVEREEAGTLERAGNYFLIPEYYQTHFELLKSQGVLEEAAERLNLPNRAEYQPRPSFLREAVLRIVPASMERSAKDLLGLQSDEAIPDIDDAQRIPPRMLKAFERNVDVKPIRGTRLAYISVESNDPAFAANAANAIAASYIDNWIETSSRTKQKANQWYSGQLERLRKKVEEAEEGLFAYRVKHGLVDAQEGQRDSGHKLGELNSELVRAEMKLVEAESRYRHLGSILGSDPTKTLNWKMLDSSTEVLGSSLIQTLRTQEIKASGQIAELMDRYGHLHPKLAHAMSELTDLRQRIQDEVEKVYHSLKHEYDMALAKVRVVKDAVARQKQEKTKLEQHEIQYGILDREAKSTRLLYEVFLKQMKDRELAPESQYTPVYLADPAVPPSTPIKPKKTLDMLIATMLGLMSSVGLALFFESRDARLKDMQDVERHHPTLPVLGIVPWLPKGQLNQLAIPEMNGSLGAAESFRALRTMLLLSPALSRPRSILVTSAQDNEGKTTVAVHLASAMAQLDHVRVVLIDSDLKKPQSHHAFQVASGNGPAKGLREFLTRQAAIDEVIHQSDVPNLSIVPSGGHASNPSDLIHSRQMATLLNYCLEQGWHVIIDAPPVLPVPEALILSSMVEGVLFVLSARETTRHASRMALHRLTSNGGKVLGLVIQKMSPRQLSPYVGINGHGYDHHVPSPHPVGLVDRS